MMRAIIIGVVCFVIGSAVGAIAASERYSPAWWAGYDRCMELHVKFERGRGRHHV